MKKSIFSALLLTFFFCYGKTTPDLFTSLNSYGNPCLSREEREKTKTLPGQRANFNYVTGGAWLILPVANISFGHRHYFSPRRALDSRFGAFAFFNPKSSYSSRSDLFPYVQCSYLFYFPPRNDFYIGAGLSCIWVGKQQNFLPFPPISPSIPITLGIQFSPGKSTHTHFVQMETQIPLIFNSSVQYGFGF